MKLHLPKLLRNSLLACITAVAGVSTTVGTAVLYHAAPAAVLTLCTLAAPAALGEAVSITADTSWGKDQTAATADDEVVVSNSATLSLDNSNGAAAANTSYSFGTSITVESGSTLSLALWTGGGSDKRNVDDSQRPIIASEIILNNSTLNIADGSYSFGGGITVSGEVTLKNPWSKGHTVSKVTSDGEAVLNLFKAHSDWGAATPWVLLNEGEFSGRVNMTNENNNTAEAIQYLVLSNGSALSNGADKYTTVVNTGTGTYDNKNHISLNTAESYLKGIGGKGTIEVCTLGGNAGLEAAKLIISNDGTVEDVFSGTVSSGVTLEIAGGTQTLTNATNNGVIQITENGTLSLGSTLQGTGTLVNSGAIVVEDWSGFDFTEAGIDDITTTGLHEIDRLYSVMADSCILSDDSTVTDFTYNGNTYSIANGYKENVKIYAVFDGTVTAGGANATAGTEQTTEFLVKGGTLQLGSATISDSVNKITLDAGDGGKATVAIANGQEQTYASLNLGSLISQESGSYVLGITGAGTVVTTDHTNSATAFHTGDISITGGGKLVINNYDALGWGKKGTAPAQILIDNGTLDMRARQTWGSDLIMGSNAVIIASSNSNDSQLPCIDVFKDNMQWTVTGAGNRVDQSVSLRLRGNVTFDIKANGSLALGGTMWSNGETAGKTMTKTGDGTLILDGVEKNVTNQIQMAAGTLKLGGTTADDGVVTLSGGINQTGGNVNVVGQAILGGTITLGGNLTIENGAVLTLDAMVNGSGTITKVAGATVNINDTNFQNFGNVIYSGTGTFAGSGYVVSEITIFGTDVFYEGDVYIGSQAYTVTGGKITLTDEAGKRYYVNKDLTYNADEMDEATTLVVGGEKTLTVNENVSGKEIKLGSGSNLTVGDGAAACTVSFGVDGMESNSTVTINEKASLALSVAEGESYAVNVAGKGAFIKNGAGTIKLADRRANGSAGVTVNAGTFDINGKALENCSVTLNDGATLANTGGGVVSGRAQINSLTIAGNAAIYNNYECGIVAGGHNPSSIIFSTSSSNNKLTKTGSGNFYLLNTTSITGSGEIAVNQGTFTVGESNRSNVTTVATGVVFSTGAVDAENYGTLKVDAGATLQAKGVQGTAGAIIGTANTKLSLHAGTGEEYTYGGTVGTADAGLNLEMAGAGTQTFTGAAHLTTVTLNAGTLKAGDGGVLNLKGTLTLAGGSLAVETGGTVAFDAASTRIDISALTPTEVDGRNVYSLFSSMEGTLDGWSELKVGNLVSNAIDVLDYAWSFNEDGSISAIQSENLTYAGGDLAWNTTDAVFNGSTKVFSNGFNATFTGDSNVNLERNIDVGTMTVNSDVTVALDGDGYSLYVAQLVNNGTLVLKDSVLSENSRVAASSTGTVKIGGEVELKGQLADYTRSLVLQDGSTLIIGSDLSARNISDISLDGTATVHTETGVDVGWNKNLIGTGKTFIKTGGGEFDIQKIGDSGTKLDYVYVKEGTLKVGHYGYYGSLNADHLIVDAGATADVNATWGHSLGAVSLVNDADLRVRTYDWGHSISALNLENDTVVAYNPEDETTYAKINSESSEAATVACTISSLGGVGNLVIMSAQNDRQHSVTITNLNTVAGTVDLKDVETLAVTNMNVAGEGDMSILLSEGSAVSIQNVNKTGSGSLTIDGTVDITGSFASNGGSIELTGELSTTDISISGTELKGTWSATGAELGAGVTVATDANLTLTDATLNDAVTNSGTLTLTGATLNAAITNSGTLTLEGTTTLGMEGVNKTIYTGGDGDNGYKEASISYTVLTGSNLALAEGSSTTWMVGDTTYTQALDDGKLKIAETDYTTYWVRSAAVDVADISDAATTTIALNGGNLRLNTTLDTTKYTAGIVAYQNGTVILGADGELNSNSVHIADGATAEVTLQGSGTYIMDTTTLPSVTGLTKADWTGKVVLSADGTGINLGNLGNSGSTIELAGVKGSLVAGSVASTVKLADGDALTISDSSEVSFSGAVTGNGTIKSTGGTQNIEFAGNISGWNGTYVNNGVATTVTIGADTTLNAALSDTAEEKKLKINFASGKTVKVNADIAAASLNNYATTTIETGKTLDVDTLANEGTLSLAQSAISLSRLTNKGTLYADGTDISVTGDMTGTGSITAKSLTLQGATNNMGSILADNLTLDTETTSTALTLTGELGISGTLTYTNYLSSVKADSLTNGKLSIAISETLLGNLAVSQNKSVTLLTLTTEMTDLTGIDVNGEAYDGSTLSFDSENDQFNYELVYDKTKGTFTLVSTLKGLEWDEYNGGNRWNKAGLEAADFNGGVIPGTGIVVAAADSNLIITDNQDNSGIIIVNGGVEVKNLTIDIWDAVTMNPIFCGGTDTVIATADSVTVHTDMSLAGIKTTTIGQLMPLTDAEGKIYANDVLKFNVGGNVTIHEGSRLFVSSLGNLEVGQNVTADGHMHSIGTVLVKGDVNVAEDCYLLSGLLAANETEYIAGSESNSMTIEGNVTNKGSLRHYVGKLSITKDTQNTGTISIQGGSAEFGTLTNAGDAELIVATGDVDITGAVDNDGSISIAGGDVDITGDVDNDGSISITGGDTKVTGNLDNTSGSLSITGGSLEVTGNLVNDKDSGSQLTVAEDTKLTVGGDLAADEMDLAFGGEVSVGGTATIGSLENNGSLSAQNATIGSLTGSGSLDIKDGGTLEIDELSGTGNVSVGVGGTLEIGNDIGFQGNLDNEGTVVTVGSMTLYKQTTAGGTLDADKLILMEAANGSVATKLTTNSIEVQKLSADPMLTLESIELKDATKGAITLELQQLTSKEGIDSIIEEVKNSEYGGISYHLLTLTSGMSVDGLLEFTEDEDLHQYLLKQGYTHSDLMSTSSYARTSQTNVYLSFWAQDQSEATWDTANAATNAGLELGTLTDGTMVLKSNDMLDHVQSVDVTTDTTLDLSGTDDADTVMIQGLTGSSDLTVTGNGDTVNVDTLQGGFGGTLALEDVTANITGKVAQLSMRDDSTATLNGVTDTNITLDSGNVTLDGTMSGGSLNFGIASTELGADVAAGKLVMTGSEINVAQTDGATVISGVGSGTTTIAGLGDMSGDVTVNLTGAGFEKYFDNARLEGGVVVADRNTGYYTDKADASVSDNGKAGLEMADAVLVYLNPQADKKPGALAGVLDVLDVLENPATSADKADELGAGLAGASTAALGMALAGDVDRQLQAMRNRTTIMGVDQSVANENLPYFNAWITAEGDRSELSENGTESGYELNSWGGTVGFDVDWTPTLTAGMALTAMYGDLDTTGADKATGSMDSVYLSAFARYAASAWTHTFVATVGKSDITLDRTVNGNSLKGETEGTGFGLMYELGRVIALDEDATTCLQPVFNVTWKHTTVDGYTEDGGELALDVDDQTLNTVTFGVGARLQTVVGESMYNRTSILEARVLAKADVGDRRGSSDVALSALEQAKGSTDSAEMGAFGLEAGAGLAVPLGQDGGSLFMDASVELRSDYLNVNGTVGYRMNF